MDFGKRAQDSKNMQKQLQVNVYSSVDFFSSVKLAVDITVTPKKDTFAISLVSAPSLSLSRNNCTTSGGISEIGRGKT